MKKSARKTKGARRQAPRREGSEAGAAAGPGAAKAKPVSRRVLMRSVASWGLLAGAVGGIGYWTAGSVRATIAEQDLSRIGDGTPTVVQVHDPQCNLCLALQVETRAALERFEADALNYVVANVKTDAGRRFAATQNVGHVTLVLFDAGGRRRETLQGPRSSAELERVFRRLLGRPAS